MNTGPGEVCEGGQVKVFTPYREIRQGLVISHTLMAIKAQLEPSYVFIYD